MYICLKIKAIDMYEENQYKYEHSHSIDLFLYD